MMPGSRCLAPDGPATLELYTSGAAEPGGAQPGCCAPQPALIVTLWSRAIGSTALSWW